VTAAQIEHAPAAKEAADPSRHFPSFVQLLARQTPGVADGARDAIEERLPREATKVPIGEPPA